jgi:chemotaxis signal transduction protein
MRALLYSIADELFASPLATIEESLDCPHVRRMPGADDHAVGVVEVRGRCIPAYSPKAALNIEPGAKPGAALVIQSGGPPVVILISDVDDVIDIDPTEIRRPPGADDHDGVLLGVFQHQGRLVSVVDPLAVRDATLAARAAR